MSSSLPQATAKVVYSAIAENGVTHFCAAPVVLSTIVNAAPEETILPLPHTVHVMTAGSAPPPSVLLGMSQKGFRVTHVIRPLRSVRSFHDLRMEARVGFAVAGTSSLPPCAQGVCCTALNGLDVVNTQDIKPVPADGKTIGEIVMRGNTIMKGYLKNPRANEETFAGGWFHTEYLGVKHPDGYVEIKDRLKHIIISGGENISSIEIENTLYTHPAILEASVVVRPDSRWGESPCAWVTLKPGVDTSDARRLAADIMNFCQEKIPGYCIPKSVVFGPLPKTATGKIQKHLLRAKAKEMEPVNHGAMTVCGGAGGLLYSNCALDRDLNHSAIYFVLLVNKI